MQKTKIQVVLDLVAFFSSLMVIIVSAATLDGEIRRVSLIGLIAGSFGAGAALTNTIRSRAELRRREKEKTA